MNTAGRNFKSVLETWNFFSRGNFFTFSELSEVENVPLRPIRVKEVVFLEIEFRPFSIIFQKSNLSGPRFISHLIKGTYRKAALPIFSCLDEKWAREVKFKISMIFFENNFRWLFRKNFFSKKLFSLEILFSKKITEILNFSSRAHFSSKQLKIGNAAFPMVSSIRWQKKKLEKNHMGGQITPRRVQLYLIFFENRMF